MPHEGDKRTVTSMGYIPGLPLNNFFLLYTYNKGTVYAELARSILNGAATTAAELYRKRNSMCQVDKRRIL